MKQGRLGGPSKAFRGSEPRPHIQKLARGLLRGGNVKGKKNEAGEEARGGLKRRSGEGVLRRVGKKGVA